VFRNVLFDRSQRKTKSRKLKTVPYTMNLSTRHWHAREARFLGLIALSLVLIALGLEDALRAAAQPGSGYRMLDRKALERRIQAGELSDREAGWYQPSTPDETGGAE
jgi:hypothetical protein